MNRKWKFFAVAMLLTGAMGWSSSVTAAGLVTPDDDVTTVQKTRRQRPMCNDSTRGRMDMSKMAEMRTNQMVKKYGLNDEQAQQLLALNQEQVKNMGQRQRGNRVKPREMTDEQRAQLKKEREQREATYEEALQKILTEKQYKQYLKDKKNRQNRAGGNRPGNMGGGGNRGDFGGDAPQGGDFGGGNAGGDF